MLLSPGAECCMMKELLAQYTVFPNEARVIIFVEKRKT